MDAGWRTPPGVSAWHRGKPGRGGPARPGLGAPRPLRACPPPRAAPPQRCRSAAGPGARGPRPPPAPASPPEAPAALSILGNNLISLGSGGGFPLLIWPFRPRVARGGGARGAREREPGCCRAARPPPGRGSARRPREREAAARAGGTGGLGERQADSAAAAAASAPAPPAPAPFARLAPLAPSPQRGCAPAAHGQRRGGGRFLGTGSAAREGAARSGKGESLGLRRPPGAPRSARRPRPGQTQLCPPPSRGGERGTATTRAPGAARPQPSLASVRRTGAALGSLRPRPQRPPSPQTRTAPSTGSARSRRLWTAGPGVPAPRPRQRGAAGERFPGQGETPAL